MKFLICQVVQSGAIQDMFYRWLFCANSTSNCRNLDIFTPFSLSERKFYFV